MSTQTLFNFDVCANKHGGVRTSVAAFARGKDGHAAMRERIRVFIVGCDFHGTTAKEIARCFGVEIHQISGRISELLRDGLIFDSRRDRIDGCRVLVARREWCNGSIQASPGQSNVKENASSPEATFIPAGSERTPAIDALSLSDTEERA